MGSYKTIRTNIYKPNIYTIKQDTKDTCILFVYENKKLLGAICISDILQIVRDRKPL